MTTDAFSGTGSATQFTLSQTPSSASSVMVFVDGILQKLTTNYTISGTTLDFVLVTHQIIMLRLK